MADLIFVFDQRTHCTIVTVGAFNPAIWAFVDKVAGVTAYVVAHSILLLGHPLHLSALLKEYHMLLLLL